MWQRLQQIASRKEVQVALATVAAGVSMYGLTRSLGSSQGTAAATAAIAAGTTLTAANRLIPGTMFQTQANTKVK